MIAALEDMDYRPEIFSSTQNLIAIHHTDSVTVWNFVVDSIVTWDVFSNYDAVCSFAPAYDCSRGH
jgi:hypothetical protein